MTLEFNKLRKSMEDYINGKLTGKALVNAIDDFVSNDHVYNLSDSLKEQVMSLQNMTAFYVSDPKLRKEHRSYFGDDMLLKLITQFLAKGAE